MSLRDKTLQALDEHRGVRVAAGPEDPNPFSKGKGLAMPAKRSIPKDHQFDPKSLKPLIKTLWALSVSLGHALTAHRQFSRLKSVSFSPDGLVGGRGYVMGIKDVRTALHEATENISTICDALYDEISAPHWRPKLGDLEKSDEDFSKLLDDAKDYMDDPEGEAEEDMEEVESRPASWSRFKKDEEQGSKVPGGGDIGNEAQGPNPARQDRPQLKQSSYRYSYDRSGNSSISPHELPGPRVDHLDRGEQTGPGGSYNRDEPTGDDAEAEGPKGYAYRSDWDNELSRRARSPVGESALPSDYKTRTEGYDFGIGDGNGDDAHGQGAGGYANPDSTGKGVYGPAAGLPGTAPAAKAKETGTEAIEAGPAGGMGLPTMASHARLPNDNTSPVARSDYYAGPKGNDFNGIARYSEAELPGDGAGGGTGDVDKDLPNTGYKAEQVTQPYVKWDSNTKNMRPDYSYQRDPLEGPYAKGEGTNDG